MNQRITTILIIFSFALYVHGQGDGVKTFKDTRIINSHSVETVQKRKLDFRVGHRFGDFAGDRGGWNTFYGLENATDIYIGLEYGLSDQLTMGIGRTKGSGALRQLVHASAKYRFITQKENGSPISLAWHGLAVISTMPKSTEPTAINFFEEFVHRLNYHTQLMVARKFSDRFSLQGNFGFTHRNITALNDENDIISIGLATRIQLNKAFGIIADATFPFSELRTTDNGYYFPLGIGLEIETGGHVFQINFTNATGIAETDFISNTTSNWGNGEFRLGFTVSRIFNL